MNKLEPNSPGRRRFATSLATGLATGAAALVDATPLIGRVRPHVVIIGGGAGGASAAQQLALHAAGALDITLIEKSARYVSCFHSNLYLGGLRSLRSLTHGYRRLPVERGINVLMAKVQGIDRAARQITLAGGEQVGYDRLILSPGIDVIHESVPGYSVAASASAPHGWKGEAQLSLLQQRFEALKNGDQVVIVAPPDPYRCPPGPYERASMMAHRFVQKGFDKSRITIVDTKNSFSKQALFDEAWQRHYPGMIDWLPADLHGGIVDVDADAGVVSTDFDDFSASLLNIIPAQRAGQVARLAELIDDTGFCRIEAGSMRSALDKYIFVIGDASSAGAMPKSAFAAHSQARVVAAAIIDDLLGRTASVAHYVNTCWSQLAQDDAVRVGATYEAGAANEIVAQASFISEPGENPAHRKGMASQSAAWYAAITADMFG